MGVYRKKRQMELWFWDQPLVENEVDLIDSLTLSFTQEENTKKFITEMLLKYLNINGNNWSKWSDYSRHGNRLSIITFKTRYVPPLMEVTQTLDSSGSFNLSNFPGHDPNEDTKITNLNLQRE